MRFIPFDADEYKSQTESHYQNDNESNEELPELDEKNQAKSKISCYQSKIR